MKNNKTQQQNIKELFKLIAEHPDLPIVPKVDSDIVAEYGFSYWLGGWGVAEIDRYIATDERCYFEKHDYDELVDKEIDGFEYNENLTEEQIEIEAEKLVDKLEWVKCISVSIVLPY